MGLSPDHTNGCEAIHVLRDAIGSEFTVVCIHNVIFPPVTFILGNQDWINI